MAQHYKQQTFVTIQPPPANTNITATPSHPRSRYKQTAARVTAYIQLICGVASIVFGVCVLLALTGHIGDSQRRSNLEAIIFGVVSWPIWSGIIFVISGSLGAASKVDNKCLIIGYMVMSLIAAVFALGQLIWESIGSAVIGCNEYTYYYGSSIYAPYNNCEGISLSSGLHLGAVLAALLEIIAAITGSAFCCHGVCCQPSPQTASFLVQYASQPQTILVTQAPGLYQSAPGPAPGTTGPGPTAPGLYASAPPEMYPPPAYSASSNYSSVSPANTHILERK